MRAGRCGDWIDAADWDIVDRTAAGPPATVVPLDMGEWVMDLMEALRGRRAIREYTAAPVPRTVLSELIKAAASAPSAMNLQPWAFAVVEGAERLADYSERAKAHVLAGMTADSPLARYRDRLADPHFHIFHHAPALVVVCATADESQSREDCCLAGLSLMLAAHAGGLGTCWIGFARSWLNRPEAKAELGIPAHYSPVAPIVVGHPMAVPPPTPRDTPEVVWRD